MNEDEFFANSQMRPWQREEVANQERIWGLAAALWGDADHLKRQLLAPSPSIPEGFDLTDLRRLEGLARFCLRLTDSASPWTASKLAWLLRMGRPTEEIVIGTDRYTVFEARYEIVRRAIAARER